MPRAAAPFRQADLTRALKAAQACGLTIGRVEIDAEGRITIETREPGRPEQARTASLDEWRRAKRGKD